MKIEEAFREVKSTRFGLSLELHLTYQVERLQILLPIATLALMVAWLMGTELPSAQLPRFASKRLRQYLGRLL